MPATRRSSGGPRSSQASSRQSTLSFNHRVTKSVPKSAKKEISSTTPVKASPLSKQLFTEEDVEVDEPKVEPTSPEIEEPEEKSAAELRAAKISDRQITGYWNKLEKERVAKRVHQEDLTLSEKVLRYFDVSSQYGPCVGISRMRRWQRADRLGLNPPAEVLAVLMKEEKKGTKGTETAHIDQILNSTSVDAV
ncbi:putative DNA polymerase delta subunit 4 [Seiridium unicorne]|uniref:DNA polymerase delta subunit 4 n=1 Tax=Seiridium unicorne TaxID=138068 RepID=A0ABR2VCV6_9PEZI